MAAAIDKGLPKLRIEEAAARTQARIDSGRQPVIGVNKYRLAEEDLLDVLKVDNAGVRKQQADKLRRLRDERDGEEVASALQALTNAAEKKDANLLALAIDAARAKATVGEISDALEAVYGRHSATIRTISGVYRQEAGKVDLIDQVRAATADVRGGAGPPAAHPRREDGPGRARPRSEGARDRLRRPRLRRRRRPAVPDTGRGRAASGRSRRAHRRRQLAGRRTPDPRPRTARTPSPSTAATTS